MYGTLVYNIDNAIVQWQRDGLLKKMALGQLVIHMLNTKSTLILYTNINSRWIVTLTVKGKTVKILEK